MGKAKLDLKHPPVLSRAEREGLEQLDERKVEQNASTDADNPPMTREELDHVAEARSVQAIRKARGMSQTVFARTYGIAVSRLRDWEQGRFKPDSLARAYLQTIRFEPDAVDRALARTAASKAAE